MSRQIPEYDPFYNAVGIMLIKVLCRLSRKSQYAVLRCISSMAIGEEIVIGDKDLEQLAREFYESQQLHENEQLYDREQ